MIKQPPPEEVHASDNSTELPATDYISCDDDFEARPKAKKPTVDAHAAPALAEQVRNTPLGGTSPPLVVPGHNLCPLDHVVPDEIRIHHFSNTWSLLLDHNNTAQGKGSEHDDGDWSVGSSIPGLDKHPQDTDASIPFDLHSQFGRVGNSDRYRHIHEWEWKKPDPDSLDPDSRLKKMLSAPEADLLGRCYAVPVNDTKNKASVYEDHELSMIRLIDYCDNNPTPGRGFIDGILDIIADEMNQRNFDPRRRLKRDTVSQKVMRVSGGGCAPSVVQVTVSTDEMNLVSTEDPLPKDNTAYLAVP